jgi:hypothetical protein
MQAAQIEKQLLMAGITLVFSDTLSAPIRLGEQSILRDLELLLAYYQGGEELRKHAERVLGFQKALAEGGCGNITWHVRSCRRWKKRYVIWSPSARLPTASPRSCRRRQPWGFWMT